MAVAVTSLAADSRATAVGLRLQKELSVLNCKFVLAAAVLVCSPTAAAIAQVGEGAVTIVIPNALLIKDGAGADARPIRSVPAGAELVVIGCDQDVCEVRFGVLHRHGWVERIFLPTATPPGVRIPYPNFPAATQLGVFNPLGGDGDDPVFHPLITQP